MAEEEVKEDKPRFSKRLALPLVGAAACGVAHRCSSSVAYAAFFMLMLTASSLLWLAVRLSRLVVEPLNRIMLRLIDFGVPAAVVVITLLALSDDEDSEDFDDDANNPPCARYSREGAPGPPLTKPLTNLSGSSGFRIGSARLRTRWTRLRAQGPMRSPLSDVVTSAVSETIWAAGVLRRWPAWRQQRRRGG